MLQDAINVRGELDKTTMAQRNAEAANEKATEDIDAANLDLKQVYLERNFKIIQHTNINNLFIWYVC